MACTISEIKYIPSFEPCGVEKVTFSYNTDGIKKAGSFDADRLMSRQNNMFLKDHATHGISNEDFFALIRCIRHGRNLFKYTIRQKSYEVWRNSCMPLEDYLPIGTFAGQEWIRNFQRLEGTEEHIFQWSVPYEPQIDCPKPEERAYHTFSFFKEKWQYRGVCRFNSTQNLVSDIEFAGKLEYPGPGPMAGETVYYRSDRDFAWHLEDAQTMGRPVNPVFLHPQDYQIDVAYGYGRDSGAVRTGSLTDRELEEEARLVLHRLCVYCEGADSRLKEYFQIPLAKHIVDRGTPDDIQAIISKLPMTGAECRKLHGRDQSEWTYILIPIDQKTYPGCGIHEDQKRFRNSNVLSIPVDEVENLTCEEADAYYRHGEEYIYQGMLYTLYRYRARNAYGRYQEEGRFVCGDWQIFVSPSSLGSFLPDVSSVGKEFVAVKDKRFQPLPLMTIELREYVMSQLQGSDPEQHNQLAYLEWPKGAGKSVHGTKPQEPVQP